MKEAVYHAVHAPEMRWNFEEYEWGEDFDKIDWISHRKAIENLPSGQSFQLVNEFSGCYLRMKESIHGYPQHTHTLSAKHAVQK